MTKGFKNYADMTDEEFEEIISAHDAQGGGLNQSRTATGSGCWDAEIKILKSCDHMEIPSYMVKFQIKAHMKIQQLMKHYPQLEWLAYLVGSIDHETHEVIVDDLEIPDAQSVSGASVNNVEYDWSKGLPIIGVIHSHNTMGAFFSGTDDAYINQNHDVSIVVSTAKHSPIKGQVRVKTPCDAYVLSENDNVKFKVEYPNSYDSDEFQKEFTSKINSYSYPTSLGVGRTTSAFPYRGTQSGSGYGGTVNRGNQHTNRQPAVVVDPYNKNHNKDVDTLTEAEIREELSVVYDEAAVDKLLKNGEAEEEIEMLRMLIDQGFDVTTMGIAPKDDNPVVKANKATATDDGEVKVVKKGESDGWDTAEVEAEVVEVTGSGGEVIDLTDADLDTESLEADLEKEDELLEWDTGAEKEAAKVEEKDTGGTKITIH